VCQRGRQRPTYAVECSLQIAMAIRCKSLQGLEPHRGGHEGSPDHERPRPSEAEHQRETEIADDMVDLQGRPYRHLRTAFLYRTELVPSCKCQPDPWESASLDRHRAYALAAEAKKGNKDAAKELQALQLKLKEGAKVAAQLAPVPAAVPANAGAPPNPAVAASAAARQAELAGRQDGPFMGLGSDAASKGKSERAEPVRIDRDRDWIKRAFEPVGR